MRGCYGILGYVTLKGGVSTKNMGKPDCSEKQEQTSMGYNIMKAKGIKIWRS